MQAEEAQRELDAHKASNTQQQMEETHKTKVCVLFSQFVYKLTHTSVQRIVTISIHNLVNIQFSPQM
jgi:hypothetical protein